MADLVINDSQVSGLIGEYTERTISKTEKFLGPELYRIIHGIFTNPLSIIGFVLIMFFVFVAVFAPQIAPPLEGTRDPYKILRDGYSPYPKEPGADWLKKAPELPFWYTTLTGKGPLDPHLWYSQRWLGFILWCGLGHPYGHQSRHFD